VQTQIQKIARELTLPDFYGKITFNFFNGRCVNVNVEQTFKMDNLNKGAENGRVRKPSSQ